MKNRAIALICTIIATASITLINNTGSDIILQDGTVLTSTDLPVHVSKQYRNRLLKDSLYITLHCSAGPKNQKIENIAAYHVNDRNWPGIGYHSAIAYNGDIHLLNDLEKITYHNKGQNTISIGVCFIGNYDKYELSDAQLKSVKVVIDAICEVLPVKGIRGHRDVPGSNKTCPGNLADKQLENAGIYF